MSTSTNQASRRPSNPKPNYRIMRKITRIERAALRINQDLAAQARKESEKGGAA